MGNALLNLINVNCLFEIAQRKSSNVEESFSFRVCTHFARQKSNNSIVIEPLSCSPFFACSILSYSRILRASSSLSEGEDFNENLRGGGGLLFRVIFSLDIYYLIPRTFPLLFSWIENRWERGGLFFKFKMRQAVSP